MVELLLYLFPWEVLIISITFVTVKVTTILGTMIDASLSVFITVVLILVYFWQYASHLLLEELFKFLLGVFVKIMLLAELVGQLCSSIAIVHNNALLLVTAKVDVNKQKWLLNLFFVINIFLVVAQKLVTFFLLLFIPIINMNILV
jgi:hypothetical protein